MKTKYLIIGGVVVAVVVVAAVFVALSLGSTDGEFNYKLEATDSFEYTSDGKTYVRSAEAGKEFIIATITIKNIGFSDGIFTNALYFKLNVNGTKYDNALATFSHPGDRLVKIEKGDKQTFTVVFEVEPGAQKAILEWHGLPPNVVSNPDLV